MTAKHVVEAPLNKRAVYVRFFINGEVTVESKVAYEDDTYDFAILTVPYRYPYAAVIAESLPEIFQKVYTAGVAVVEVVLCNPGELTGQRKESWYVSSPANWGYSGGPVSAFISGRWRVVGIVRSMGVIHDPLGIKHPVYHTISVLKMDIILAKLEAEQAARH